MTKDKIYWNQDLTLTREFRAKNLLGLSTCRFTRMFGQTSEDNLKNDHLAIFPFLENGIHASIAELRFKYVNNGLFIPALLGNRWSGDLTKRYGVNLSRVMRVLPYWPLSFSKRGDDLMRAMAIMENGDPARNIPKGYFGQFINEV